MKDRIEDNGLKDGKASRLNLSFGRFRRSTSGAAAVEFALLGLPFFMILFAILETALVFIGQMNLQHAVDEVAREVRTGQTQSANMSADAFRQRICNDAVFFDCNKLKVDLRRYTDYASVPKSSPIVVKNGKKTLDDKNFGYDTGATSTIMALRVYYSWPLYADFIQKTMSQLNDGNFLMVATNAFVTEPF